MTDTELKEYRAKIFRDALAEWKKKTGWNESVFAERIRAHQNSITNWKKSFNPRNDYLYLICQELGIDSEVFFPQIHSEKYRSDTEYIKTVGNEWIQFCKSNGISIKFIEALKEITDFDTLFPLFRPLVPLEYSDDNTVKYGRMTPSDSAYVKDAFFQIERNGEHYNLTKGDYIFIKKLQDNISNYISYLFWKRSEEMNNADKKVQNIKTMDFIPLPELLKIESYDEYYIQEIDKKEFSLTAKTFNNIKSSEE